ncbi:MAG: aromatic-L-amino-acid/L-tryptophan decarboxylase [Chloroflexota bacterium]|jgi:glutamate/tyrosine decarboxylase-like PLP-dependent enzyme|nr:aromatic-L-amino-acid/L-tryptophan decarboxylase [Chloroflexota bacterium]
MPDRSTANPMAPADLEAYLARFAWHPEPELIGYRDAGASRAELERLGAETWSAALDFLYGHAMDRAMGAPSGYEAARRSFYGADAGPSAAPAGPTPSAAILDEFRTRLAGGQMNSQHPRQFGYFTPPPLPISIMGELLAQMTNQGVDVWHAGPLAAFVEEEVVRWLCDLAGYGPESFGLLTSGGVMANFMAMTLARDIHLGRILEAGRPPRGSMLEGVRVYTSDQSHFSIARSLDQLGFPPETLAIIPADAAFHLRGEPVTAAIARDRAAGLTPFAIAAVAGSTNTGSVDAIGELADVASAEDLWFHVDAAYGGAVRLSTRDAGRVPALDRVDSITVDPHKWFFQAYDIGGLIVREGGHLATVFGGRAPEYYRGGEDDHGARTFLRQSPLGNTHHPREIDDGGAHGGAYGAAAGAARGGAHGGAAGAADDDHGDQLNFYKLGFEGTRRWRALKLWMSWKHLGTQGFGRLIEANDDLAAHLARRCAAADDFEALPEVPELSVVCFRHLPGGRDAALALPPAELDAHQDGLQSALEISGDGWLTTTRLRGATYLRAGIVNYLSTEDDVDRLLATLRSLADQSRPRAASRS